MSEKYTPGPWRVKGTRVYPSTMQVSNQPAWDDDARVIAAAPDMFDALGACLGTLEVCFPDAPMDSVIGKNILAARAAIAKATGGQNEVHL